MSKASASLSSDRWRVAMPLAPVRTLRKIAWERGATETDYSTHVKRLPDGTPAPDIEALLSDVLLSEVRSLLPSALSLGMARRVALARAMAVDPEVLVLDEPFVSLDAELAARLRAELAAFVTRRPVTTLLVSHDVDAH